MKEQVWFIIKRGEERRFATPYVPSKEWSENLKKEGYSIFHIEFEMPPDWDTADKTIETKGPADRKDFVCIAWGPLEDWQLQSGHLDCPVIVQDGVPPLVCKCECFTCKRAWWAQNRPTVKDGKIVYAPPGSAR